MFCPQCGQDNADGTAYCVRCGRQLVTVIQPGAQASTVTQPGIRVPNYLVFAILSTVLCCLPAGIVAIVYAASVDGKALAGDIAGAQRASQNAKLWCMVSVGAALTIGVLYGLFIVAMIVLGHHRYQMPS